MIYVLIDEGTTTRGEHLHALLNDKNLWLRTHDVRKSNSNQAFILKLKEVG